MASLPIHNIWYDPKYLVSHHDDNTPRQDCPQAMPWLKHVVAKILKKEGSPYPALDTTGQIIS